MTKEPAMEKVEWKVTGMTCANCALTVNKYLQQQGAKSIVVNPIDGDVSFDATGTKSTVEIAKGIESLGYKVLSDESDSTATKRRFLSTNLQRFWFCLPFTLVLMLHMIPGVNIHILMNPLVQLALTLPVYIVGMSYFGRSAIKSIRNKVLNMNVLIAIGASAAFIYSLFAVFGMGIEYLFFETTATIITLVFLGNYLEDASVQSTQRSLKALVKSQKVIANMIAFDGDHKEVILPLENTQLKVGDLVLIRTGEQVPADCKILWGDAHVSEAIITGESTPVFKTKKDNLIGGSILEDGNVKAQVTAAGNDTILSNILSLVKKAQGEKPPMQQMADKISAIFVPAVLAIAVLTLIINWIILKDFTPSLLRSIAVLVIACPCAMGLATPAAIAVGLGRGARNGILFRNAKGLELFKDIKQVVFDKTGTLTTGKFIIDGFQLLGGTDESTFKRIVFSMEKHSNHPLAKSITAAWRTSDEVRWQKIEEIKGKGITAVDKEGNAYALGSYKVAEGLTDENDHNIYVAKNGALLGWIDLKDELRPEAKEVVRYLQSKGLKTILLSGDRFQKTKELADSLGISEVIAEQTPEQKLEKIEALSSQAPTAMVGDGINDAPALAKATIGISMSEASQIAMQSAQVVLMSNGLQKLPTALGLGKHTFMTIKQNLFWAFSYNIVAIPVAAIGLLGHYGPTYGALIMALSDVVLAANSVRLYVKKVV
jgi:Cu+-exporting ATPase